MTKTKAKKRNCTPHPILGKCALTRCIDDFPKYSTSWFFISRHPYPSSVTSTTHIPRVNFSPPLFFLNFFLKSTRVTLDGQICLSFLFLLETTHDVDAGTTKKIYVCFPKNTVPIHHDQTQSVVKVCS